MNWYKTAQASFQTFGIEDKIAQSFVRHYSEFLNGQDIPTLQREFDQKKSIHIGSANVSKAIQPIIEHYGEPQTPIPTKLNFVLLNRTHPSAGNDSAFFLVHKGAFIIGKILDKITDFKDLDNFTYSIQHEFQHFLRSLYVGKTVPDYAKNLKEERSPKAYWEDPWEIQSHSSNIAQKAMDDIKGLYSFRIKNTTPENIPAIKDKIANSKNALVSKFVLAELKKLFEKCEVNLSTEIRKKYYMATIKNFGRLFDQFINKL